MSTPTDTVDPTDLDSANNATPVPEGHFKVWAYGLSAILPTLEAAEKTADRARRWCSDVSIVAH